MIAVASGINDELMRGLGAEQFTEYTNTAADEVLRNVDLVLDTVGSKEAARFLKTLKRGGALFLVFRLSFDAQDRQSVWHRPPRFVQAGGLAGPAL